MTTLSVLLYHCLPYFQSLSLHLLLTCLHWPARPWDLLAPPSSAGISGMHCHVWLFLWVLRIQTTVFIRNHNPSMRQVLGEVTIFILTFFLLISLCLLVAWRASCWSDLLPLTVPLLSSCHGYSVTIHFSPHSLFYSHWSFSSFVTPPHIYILLHKLNSQKNKYKGQIGIFEKNAPQPWPSGKCRTKLLCVLSGPSQKLSSGK